MFSLSPWIFATENCNLRCPYCFEGHVNKNMSKEVWSATSEHFIQLVQDHVIRRTHWGSQEENRSWFLIPGENFHYI